VTSQPPRTYTRVAVAIVVAAAIIATVLVATSFTSATGNTTVTVTGTATAPGGSRLYEVTFRQSGDCTPSVYVAPWSVTLGPWTVVEPSNATLPIGTNARLFGPSDVNNSVITFSVPNGQYQYSIATGGGFANPSGVITVDGGDVMVLLQGPEISCSSSSSD
jgi:hypothetical protein